FLGTSRTAVEPSLSSRTHLRDPSPSPPICHTSSKDLTRMSSPNGGSGSPSFQVAQFHRSPKGDCHGSKSETDPRGVSHRHAVSRRRRRGEGHPLHEGGLRGPTGIRADD